MCVHLCLFRRGAANNEHGVRVAALPHCRVAALLYFPPRLPAWTQRGSPPVFAKPRQVRRAVSSISGVLEEKSGSENCFYLGVLSLFDRCREVIKSQSTSLPDSPSHP